MAQPHVLQYDLRPCKQVERRMLLDACQLLQGAGLPLRKYTYLGMGSVFFYDYVLFHKLLGVERMISCEDKRSAKRRVQFNRPFRMVRIAMKPIGRVLESLESKSRYLAWLDYDSQLSQEILYDLVQAGYRLGRGSLLFVTIDVEPPKLDRDDLGPSGWMEHFEGFAEEYMHPEWMAADFRRSRIHGLVSAIAARAISEGCSRAGTNFMPLFHFLYKDGSNQMMSLGGLIGGVSDYEQIIEKSGIRETVYYRPHVRAPYVIRVPRITRRERLMLDRELPTRGRSTRRSTLVPSRDMSDYAALYRFMPAYAEILL